MWYPYEEFKEHFDKGQMYVTFRERELARQSQSTNSSSASSFSTESSQDTLVEVDDDKAYNLTNLSLPKRSLLAAEHAIFAADRQEDLQPPYNVYHDGVLRDSVFETMMPGIHPRALIKDSEGLWGKWVYIHERQRIRPYWASTMCKYSLSREEIREMVAMLGIAAFEMVFINTSTG